MIRRSQAAASQPPEETTTCRAVKQPDGSRMEREAVLLPGPLRRGGRGW
jgi:hypothetical protein